LVSGGSSRGGYRERTLQNVLDSDGTVILFSGGETGGDLTGGTRLTRTFCQRNAKPYLIVDASRTTEADAAASVATFIEEHAIRTLNVAGPRLSGWPQGQAFTAHVVGEVLKGRVRTGPDSHYRYKQLTRKGFIARMSPLVP
jgi:hypothetical protein